MNYQDIMARIEPLRYSHDLDSMEATVDSLATEIEQQEPETFIRFLVAACDMLNSYDFGDYARQTRLVHQYANRALQKATAIPLELELQILAHLEHDFEEETAPVPWPEKRRERTQRILKVLQQISESVSLEASPEDIPLINVPPPPSAHLPAGVGPEHIRNAMVRRKYEADRAANERKAVALRNRWALHQLNERYTPGLIRHVIAAYEREPSNSEELQGLINEHLSSEALRKSVLERLQQAGVLQR